MTIKPKIIKTSTVPMSLDIFCREQLRELSERYDVVVLSSSGKELDELGCREGVRTVSVEMERHISPFKDIKSLLQLVSCFRNERPWMVHSMTPKAGLLCMVAACVARVPRRVHTFTGLVWPTTRGLKRRVLKAADRLLCRCATHIIPEGEGVKRDLQEGGITKKSLKVLANGNVRGIDLDYFAKTPEVMACAENNRKADVLTFLFVGRLVGDKGIVELVDAFDRLYSENKKVRLVLVGSEEWHLDPLPQSTLEKIKSHEAIDAVGYQNDVRHWLAAADVFVFPSYREGFPNVVIEAGAMELPSIVTDINGSNEIIVSGENGLIVPVKDVAALHDAMSRFVQDGSLRAKMAKQARVMVESRYDCHMVRQALYDFYASLE